MVRTVAFKSCSMVMGSPSLRAQRSNPEAENWIASSQELLAMTKHLVRLLQPERILHDPQAHLAAQRHQRLRVKLYAADRQRPVLDRHGDAVLGRRGDIEHVGH